MADLDVNMIMRAYDQLCPLHLGDVPTPGLRLKIDRHSPLTLVFPDGVDVAEVSFNRYVGGYAKGDDSLVGMPAFVLRGFRHRNFFVRSDSPLKKLSDLKGKRVGTNSWPDTGTMWARIAMVDAGVGIPDVQWVIGTLDEKTPNKPPSPNDAQPPKGARLLGGSENLLKEMAEGRVDCVTTAKAPAEVFKKGGAIRRLVEDYPAVEADYHSRTGVYPGFHVMAVRRSFAEKHPKAVMTIYEAMQKSWTLWEDKVKWFAEDSPWAMKEMELLCNEFADDAVFGMSKANQRMVETICREQHAQGLVPKAADPKALFAGFETARKAAA
jgi:4,5-dihydroxyphthalate decarboxylase